MTETMQPVELATSEEEEIKFHAGAANKNEIVLIGKKRDAPAFEYEDYIISYEPGRDIPWLYVQMETYIPTVISGKLPDKKPDYFFVLSEDGEFWGLSDPGYTFSERIPESGYNFDDSKYGGVVSLFQLGGDYFVGGENGQVYHRQFETGKWLNIAGDLLETGYLFRAIAGHDKYDLYILGREVGKSSRLQGYSYGVFYSSSLGKWDHLGTFKKSLASMIPANNGKDVVIGGNGRLAYQGNHKDGFVEIAREQGGIHNSGHAILSMCYFQDELYASAGGLCRLENGEFRPVDVQIHPSFSLLDSIFTDTDGEYLYCLGNQDLVRFDGSRWERIPFPGNPPIE